MEFYVLTTKFNQFFKKFQFPTGWNSTMLMAALVPKDGVSIPNGMEFYRSWWYCRALSIYVSIPNGMEFYNILTLLLVFVSSFNSQRDGILRRKTAKIPYLSQVSIPNGMEFYITSVDGSCMNICFNSQRDGILPIVKPHIASSGNSFQFPTGWNSTARILPFF